MSQANNRLRKLTKMAQAMATSHSFRPGRRRQCVGASWEKAWELFLEAVPEESYDIMEDILRQILDYEARPVEEDGSRPLHRGQHGFLQWIEGLRAGWAELPEVIPPIVLLAWRNEYKRRRDRGKHWLATWRIGDGYFGTSVVTWRCVQCRMVLPNATPEVGGYGACIFPCPVCGGLRMQGMNLARWGEFGHVQPAAFFGRGPRIDD